MPKKNEIRLLYQGREVATATADVYLGKKDFRSVHNDATYLSDPQFHLFLARDGRWNIGHVAGANNETLVDGHSLKREIVITSGMTITVGNSANGIQKFPLTLEIDTVGNISKNIKLAKIGSSTASALQSVSGAVGNLTNKLNLSKIGSSITTAFQSVASKVSNLTKNIDWAKVGSSTATIFRTVASALGVFLGAILRGMASGGASSFGIGSTRIHRGYSHYSEVILTINGTRVHEGNSMYGQVIMTINGNQIHRGDSMFGQVIVTVDGQTVHEGSSIFGTPIATINGDSVHEGYSIFGTTIATIEGGGRMAGAAAAAYLLVM